MTTNPTTQVDSREKAVDEVNARSANYPESTRDVVVEVAHEYGLNHEDVWDWYVEYHNGY